MDRQTLGPELRALIKSAVAEALASESAGRLAYTYRQAGEACGLPWTRIRDAHHRGELRAKRVGRTWLITRAELLRWLG